MPPGNSSGIDLHLHTTCSDGALTPEETVQAALQRGLSLIAITDHDTTAGVTAAQQAAVGSNLTVIAGIELNTDYKEKETHVLGYGIDPDAEALQAALKRMIAGRRARNFDILDKLRAAGMPLVMDELEAIAAGEIIARPHIAKAMINHGYVRSTQEAFDRFLGKGACCFVERISLTPQEACTAVLESGGLPVLAHPGRMHYEELIAELLPAGLRGIEVYHPDHDAGLQRKLAKLAEAQGLLITGGSDSHGPGRLGRPEMGSLQIPDTVKTNLLAALAELKPKAC